jgi:hypothetical protein
MKSNAMKPHTIQLAQACTVAVLAETIGDTETSQEALNEARAIVRVHRSEITARDVAIVERTKMLLEALRP